MTLLHILRKLCCCTPSASTSTIPIYIRPSLVFDWHFGKYFSDFRTDSWWGTWCQHLTAGPWRRTDAFCRCRRQQRLRTCLCRKSSFSHRYFVESREFHEFLTLLSNWWGCCERKIAIDLHMHHRYAGETQAAIERKITLTICITCSISTLFLRRGKGRM